VPLRARRSSFSDFETGFSREVQFKGFPFTVHSRQFTLSADLFRGEGAQGLLVSENEHGQGYLLIVRMDVPKAGWYLWNAGKVRGPVVTTHLTHLDPLPMLQRDLRLGLTSVVIGQLLSVVILGLYLLGLAAGRLLSNETGLRMSTPARRLLCPHVLDCGAFVLAGAGFVAAALVAGEIFARIPHGVDSVAYLFQANILALRHLWVPAPSSPAFFSEMHLIVYHGRWFTHDTPGWPLLLAIGVGLHLPWLVNPALGAIGLVLIYLTGREVYGRPVAFGATLLTLTSPFFLFLAGSFMSHTATIVYLMGFVYLLVLWCSRAGGAVEGGSWQRSGQWRLLAPAGFLLGMAFATRQLDTLAFALPFTMLLARRWRSSAWLILGAGCPVLLLLLYNWALSGSLRLNLYTMQWAYDRPGFGSDIGPSGFTLAQGLWNTSYRLEMLHAHLFGWPFYVALAIAAVPFILGRANRWDTLFAFSAISVMAAYICFWWPGVSFGPRYWSAAIPCFALLAARGFSELYHWPLSAFRMVRQNRGVALAGPLALASSLLLYDLAYYMPAQFPLYREYDYMSPDPMHAVSRASIHHALIFVVAHPHRWSYGEVFPGNSPSLDGDIVYAHDRGVADALLMRLYPGWSYYRLSDTKLTRLDCRTARRVPTTVGVASEGTGTVGCQEAVLGCSPCVSQTGRPVADSFRMMSL
jgi:hypothetical protein